MCLRYCCHCYLRSLVCSIRCNDSHKHLAYCLPILNEGGNDSQSGIDNTLLGFAEVIEHLLDAILNVAYLTCNSLGLSLHQATELATLGGHTLHCLDEDIAGNLACLDLLLYLLDGVGNVKTHNLGYRICDRNASVEELVQIHCVHLTLGDGGAVKHHEVFKVQTNTCCNVSQSDKRLVDILGCYIECKELLGSLCNIFNPERCDGCRADQLLHESISFLLRLQHRLECHFCLLELTADLHHLINELANAPTANGNVHTVLYIRDYIVNRLSVLLNPLSSLMNCVLNVSKTGNDLGCLDYCIEFNAWHNVLFFLEFILCYKESPGKHQI